MGISTSTGFQHKKQPYLLKAEMLRLAFRFLGNTTYHQYNNDGKMKFLQQVSEYFQTNKIL